MGQSFFAIGFIRFQWHGIIGTNGFAQCAPQSFAMIHANTDAFTNGRGCKVGRITNANDTAKDQFGIVSDRGKGTCVHFIFACQVKPEKLHVVRGQKSNINFFGDTSVSGWITPTLTRSLSSAVGKTHPYPDKTDEPTNKIA